MTHIDHDGGLGLGPENPVHSPAGLTAEALSPEFHDTGLPLVGPGSGAGLAATAATAATAAPAAPEEIGNPGEYQHFWFDEGQSGYCVPASVTEVIECQTGMSLHGFSVVEQEASKLGIKLGSQGLTLQQAGELLAGVGIPSHIEALPPQEALSVLGNYLAQGSNIILSVNASPIWYDGSDTALNPGGSADHALVISAIDPQTQTVTLSDPGSPGGNEEQVPMGTFLQAWSASDYEMLVTDSPAGGADHAAATSAVDNLEDSSGAGYGIGYDLGHDAGWALHNPAAVVLGFVLTGTAVAGVGKLGQVALEQVRKHRGGRR
jgi:hypothetical protein